VLLAGLSCKGCGGPRGPNVLLVTIDSLRADHLHGLGYSRETTPVLDGLLREGTAWTGVVTPAPWTTPSMMSLMTGLYPEVHHVDEDDRVLASSVRTLAQRFGDAGYTTAAFVPEATLTARFGFSRGFARFDERDFGHSTVTSPAQSSAVIDFIQRSLADQDAHGGRGRFFVWVHLWDPHYNYNPPPPYETRFLAGEPPSQGSVYNMIALKSSKNSLSAAQIENVVGQYDGEIAVTDHYLGEILDALRAAGRLDSTIVVVAGDHGEAFQEHGWLTHTNTVYEETVRVPLIARWPAGLPAGRRIGGARSLVDLSGSLADWAGLAPLATQSQPLPLEEPAPGNPGKGDTLVVSTTRRQASVLSARSRDWSLVLDYEACRAELYDLSVDAGQARDLALSRPEIVADLAARLVTWIETGRRDHPLPITRLKEADPELFEKLAGLGYADGRDLFGDQRGTKTEIDPLACLTSGRLAGAPAPAR
jgi:arylsulfatase A-like enzyme